MNLLLALLSLLDLAMADTYNDWHPAGPGDVRSPCPALNSLANHDILPHNGRNMTIPVLVSAMNTGLKVSPETATFLAMAGLAIAKDPASGAFDLDEMNKHNGFEHDASLSRKDYDLGGEKQEFSWEIFNETLSYYTNKDKITLKDVADARWGREKSSRAKNPKFSLDAKHKFISYIESAAYHEIFRNPTTRTAPLDWIVIWFSQERLPYKEGWKPVNDITGITIAADTLQMALLAPEVGQ